MGLRAKAQVRPRGESPRCPQRPSTRRACLRAASGVVDAPHRKSRFGAEQVLVVVLDLARGLGADRDTAEALLVALCEMRLAARASARVTRPCITLVAAPGVRTLVGWRA